MRRRVFCSLLFFLLCRFAVADEKSRILALENSWNQAELHNDAHAVDMLLADDFVMTVADGYTMNKAAMLASVRDTSYKPDVLQSDNMQVHMYGNTAIVTGSYLEKGQRQRKTLRAPRPLHRHLGELLRRVALRSQPLQRETVTTTERQPFVGNALHRWSDGRPHPSFKGTRSLVWPAHSCARIPLNPPLPALISPSVRLKFDVRSDGRPSLCDAHTPVRECPSNPLPPRTASTKHSRAATTETSPARQSLCENL